MKGLHYVCRKGTGAIDAPTPRQFRVLAERYRLEAEVIRVHIGWLEGRHEFAESREASLAELQSARVDLLWCERAVQRLERATCWDDLATGR